MVGALPMITGSFIVTFLSAIVATPFAIGAAVFMTEISPKNGTKILQPVIELLSWYSVCRLRIYRFICYRAFCQKYLWRDRVRYLSWYICVIRYDLTDCHNDDCGCIKGSAATLSEASLALGATRWQTIYKVVLRAAVPGILTAVVLVWLVRLAKP